jgi:hypothetical protein
MPTYFHDAANQTVYLAEDSRWAERHAKPTSRAPRPELLGWDVNATVISMSATRGVDDRQLHHLYPTPRYARELAHRMWDAHLRLQIPGTEITKDEYERLLVQYETAYKASQKGRP